MNPTRSFCSLHRRMQRSYLQQISRQLSTKTERKVGKDGPTAVMFMNMGGPVDQGEVRSFLHRLFVRHFSQIPYQSSLQTDSYLPNTVGWRHHSLWKISEDLRKRDHQVENPKDPETVCRDWWWFSNTQMVRVTSTRNLQDSRQDVSFIGTSFALRRLPVCSSSDRRCVCQAPRGWFWQER